MLYHSYVYGTILWFTNISILQLKDDDPEKYNHIKPTAGETYENNIKKATNVRFFEDWFPEQFTEKEEDDKSRPRTVNHIDIRVHNPDKTDKKHLTIADIDKRAREVRTPSPIAYTCLCSIFYPLSIRNIFLK